MRFSEICQRGVRPAGPPDQTEDLQNGREGLPFTSFRATWSDLSSGRRRLHRPDPSPLGANPENEVVNPM
jgi:hypothetical protein